MFIASSIGFLLVICVSAQDTNTANEYVKPQRPKGEDGGALKVGIAWHISRIHHVNVNDMFLEVTLRSTISWQDDKMTSQGSPDGPLSLSMDYLKKVWKPDVYFKETRDLQKFTMLDDVGGLWLYRKNGTFVLSFLMKITLDCPMRFTLFPFDVQTCRMTLLSYEYNESEMYLYWLSQGLTVTQRLQDQIPSYYLTIRPANVTTDFSCQNCHAEPATALVSAIRLERRYVTYLITTFFPSFFLVGIAWASLFWTPDPTPGRTTLAITSLLTIVALYGSVRYHSPRSDYSKGTDVWFFFCICFNVAIISEFATVIWMRRLQNKLIKASTVAVEPINQVDPSSNPRPVPAGKKQASLRLQTLQWREEKLESISKWLFPLIFLIFNLTFWSFYLHKYDKSY